MTTGAGRPAEAYTGESDSLGSDVDAIFDERLDEGDDVNHGLDGATTSGGPAMILIMTGIVCGVMWLRRRRRT